MAVAEGSMKEVDRMSPLKAIFPFSTPIMSAGCAG